MVSIGALAVFRVIVISQIGRKTLTVLCANVLLNEHFLRRNYW